MGPAAVKNLKFAILRNYPELVKGKSIPDKVFTHLIEAQLDAKPVVAKYLPTMELERESRKSQADVGDFSHFLLPGNAGIRLSYMGEKSA
jgi:hypothetical protein